MNDPVISTTATDVSQLVAALQRQVFLLLVALIVVAATLVFYLYYQSRIESKDLAAIRPSAMAMIQEYRNNATMIQNFEKQLVTYGTTHPTFRPVLIKYGLVPNPAAKALAP
ncbi:MAG: hypothetical protein ACREFR_16530 [Limisphaerales bacterium]